ncbi:hypothetical protein TYRP_019428 [Tyrophagus putrescentiae]|nr:hypothetical protein TYRP_019428 [Tyrophagus putrescentiae]
MLKTFTLIATLFGLSQAYGYGAGAPGPVLLAGPAPSYGPGPALLSSGPALLAAGPSYGAGPALVAAPAPVLLAAPVGYGPGPLAVHTRQRVNYIPTPSSGYAAPTPVGLDAQSPPISLNYRTFSAPISIQHVHVPGQGSFRASSSQDPPHVRVHTVRQQVLPVREEVETVVARNVGQQQQAAPVLEQAAPVFIQGGGNGGGLGGGNGGGQVIRVIGGGNGGNGGGGRWSERWSRRW